MQKYWQKRSIFFPRQIGCNKFSFLKISTQKLIVFRAEESINFCTTSENSYLFYIWYMDLALGISKPPWNQSIHGEHEMSTVPLAWDWNHVLLQGLPMCTWPEKWFKQNWTWWIPVTAKMDKTNPFLSSQVGKHETKNGIQIQNTTMHASSIPLLGTLFLDKSRAIDYPNKLTLATAMTG